MEQSLKEESWFNAALIDPQAVRSVSKSSLYSKGKNSPLNNQDVKGSVSAVFVDGRRVF